MADYQNGAAVPTQQVEVLEVDGNREETFRGLVLDKTKLIILVLVFSSLLIIIIVLAAVLAHEQAKDGRQIASGKEGRKEEIAPTTIAGKGGKEDKDKEVDPTSIGPTTSISPTGRGPWWQIRLPGNIQPYHYDLTLHVDLNKPFVKGTVDIWINVSSSAPYILLHTRNMNFTRVEVLKVSGEKISLKQHFKFDKNQFLVIELESPLEKGLYITTVEYSGEYADNLRGLYKASFKYKNGTESLFSATQFEPLRARKAFPCFDEPAMKATFSVIIVHDPRLIALSNMPINQTEIKDGWKYDHFVKTVKMSTYLAAFAVGDFKYKETKTDKGVEIRVYAREEVLDQVDYALTVSNETMMYFEQFFGVPYTLPKSDAIALPVFGPSAMENWGLIKYRENLLLLKEGETSSKSKESIAKIIAHEMGHQWFGNIVTMKWWTDLWLNEGFATYVSTVGVEHNHPDWKMVEQFIVIAVQYALQLDGLAGSHAVRIPVEDPKQIGAIFDSISYKKGGSILLMLHHSLGNMAFRNGLKRYLTKHAFGNAGTDDLWDAMTEASQAAGKAIDVRKMMRTFTLQMGYPVVTITKSSKPKTYQATQERFLYHKDPNANYSSSPYGYKWVVPFSYFTGPKRARNPPSKTVANMIEKDPVEIPWDGNGWIKGNIGQTGFYRVNYDESNWDELVAQLNFFHKVFSATDRAGLIDDSFNLAWANLLNHTKALRISTYLTAEQDYVPLLSAMRKFTSIMNILPSTRPAYKYLQKYVAYLTKAQYNALGMKDQGTHLEKFKRSLLIKANCAAGVSSCLGNMTEMFQKWMYDPVINAVPPDLKAMVYYFGVARGGEKEWDFVFKQFTTSNVVSDKQLLLYAMAGTQEPWLIERYLNYGLDSSKIGPQYFDYVFRYISDNNALGSNVAWNFFRMEREKISKMFGSRYLILISSVSSRFSTEYQLQQLLDFIESANKDASLPWSVKQAIEKVKVNIQWRKTHEQDVENWLKNFFKDRPFDPDFSKPSK